MAGGREECRWEPSPHSAQVLLSALTKSHSHGTAGAQLYPRLPLPLAQLYPRLPLPLAPWEQVEWGRDFGAEEQRVTWRVTHTA